MTKYHIRTVDGHITTFDADLRITSPKGVYLRFYANKKLVVEFVVQNLISITGEAAEGSPEADSE